jgi:hypothetical protein
MNVSLYSSRQEENIFIRKQARTWKRSGLITDDQLKAIRDETDPEIRQANTFFRIIFFIFTSLCTPALMGLFSIIVRGITGMAYSFTLIVTGGIFYFLAERAVRKYRYYRYGMEEALALSSMIMICIGLMNGPMELISGKQWSANHAIVLCLLFALNACWLYLRFGYLYAASIGLISVCLIPFQLSLPPESERGVLLIILCLVFFLNIIRDKPEKEDFRKDRNTTIQAYLLVAIYLTVNLEILGVTGLFMGDKRSIHAYMASFPPYAYWLSYILTFVIPVLGIYGGIRKRKRLIINASLVLACLTIATNKSYLGLTRYAWDPAIMGFMLIAVVIFMTRWLKSGSDSNRYGFTESNILKAESHGINLSDVAAALTPTLIDAPQAPSPPENDFKGGSSGGGGASGNF